MTAFSPTDVAQQLGSGLLSFPVTHFTPDLSFDETAYRENIAWLGQLRRRRGCSPPVAPESSSPCTSRRSSRSSRPR